MPFISQNIGQLNINSQAILQQYSQITNLANGTLAKAILNAINNSLGTSYTTLTTQAAQVYVSTASGTSLDMIGVLFNTLRGGTKLASGSQIQKFFTANGASFGSLPGISALNNIIPAGTIVQNADGSIQYTVSSNISFLNTDTVVYGDLQALKPGAAYNAGANTLQFTNLNSQVPGILTTNVSTINNGSNTMADPDYRYILSKAITAAEAGNETAIRLAALSAPNVSQVLLIPYYLGVGTGTVLVITTDVIASLADLQGVSNNIVTVTSLGEQVAILPPRYIGIELYAKLIFQSATPTSQYAIIAQQVSNNLFNWLNNFNIGANFVINDVIQQILNTSDQIYDVVTTPGDPSALSIYIWSPSTSYIDPTTGNQITNRVRQPLTQNYKAFFDDAIRVERDMYGFTHNTGFQAINITF